MNDIIVNTTNGQLTVSSIQVATDFEKRHDHVIRDIENLIRQTSAETSANLTPQNWGVKNLFIKSTYTNERGRSYTSYDITRDGFSLLVMGFTGKKALEWKLKYIEAFNFMESKLREQDSRKAFTELLQRQSELEKRLEVLESNKKLLVQDMQNPVHTFIKECCIMRVNYRDGITTSKLYRAFEMWCRYNTPYAPSKSDFIAGILSYYNTNNKKCIKKKCNGYYYYIITLNPRSIRKLL